MIGDHELRLSDLAGNILDGVAVDCGGCTIEEDVGLIRLLTQPPGDLATVTISPRSSVR